MTCGGALLGAAVVIGSSWLHVKGGEATEELLPGGSNPACSPTLLRHQKTTRNRSAMTMMMLTIR